MTSALYRIALLAYPAAFRRQFGDDLDRVFRLRLEAARSRAFPSRVAFLGFLLADAVFSGLAERIRVLDRRWAWPRDTVTPSPSWSASMRDSLLADLRLAFRHLRRSPLFALVTIGSLALGIGANAAIFSAVHAVLLRPLPYDAPDRLVIVWSDNSRQHEPQNPVSPANFEAFRQSPSFAGSEAMYSFLTPASIRISSEPEVVQMASITPGMFQLLGRQALIGRAFQPGDPDTVVVLGYDYWRRRFGDDRGVIGRQVTVTDAPAPATIIGVMPQDFVFPYRSMLGPSGFTRAPRPDAWVPLTARRDPRLLDATGQPNRSLHYLAVIGRLSPQATLASAARDLKTISARRALTFPDTNNGWGVTVRSLHDQTVGSSRAAILTLAGGVVVVMLITCLNVANILVARATTRQRELSVRAALGASARRLCQQTLIESVALSAAGGVAGLLLAVPAMRAIVAMAPADVPRLSELSPGWPLLAFGVCLSLVTGALIGVLPALSAARIAPMDALRDGRSASVSPGRRRARSALIVAEVALATVLSVGGGLLVRSLVAVLNVDPGFAPEHLLTMQLTVPPRLTTAPARLAFYDDLEARLRAVPGVVDIGGTTRLPLGSTSVSTKIEIEGRNQSAAEQPEVEMRRSVFDYFRSMSIPLIRGRAFGPEDSASAPGVVAVNTTMAEREFPGDTPIGRRIRFGGPQAPWLTIVAEIGSVRHASLEETPKPEMYLYYRQAPPVNPFLTIRTAGDPAALTLAARSAVHDAGADPPTDIRTMAQIRASSVDERRFVVMLVAGFGVLALVLASLGVYGVIALVTAERTAEVGLRLALGATPSEILGLVTSYALKLAASGIGIGIVAMLLASPALSSQLFGVRAADPLTYVVVIGVLTISALGAAIVPARRAMRVDPAVALRP